MISSDHSNNGDTTASDKFKVARGEIKLYMFSSTIYVYRFNTCVYSKSDHLFIFDMDRTFFNTKFRLSKGALSSARVNHNLLKKCDKSDRLRFCTGPPRDKMAPRMPHPRGISRRGGPARNALKCPAARRVSSTKLSPFQDAAPLSSTKSSKSKLAGSMTSFAWNTSCARGLDSLFSKQNVSGPAAEPRAGKPSPQASAPIW
jgi:hypothetical protein